MLYIVCALHCEAKPIIDFYKLSIESEASFPVFSNQHMGLIVAGIGKISVAAAMAYLYARGGEKKHIAWLNIGIAGHRTFPLGCLININKVTDESSQVNWYPARYSELMEQSSSLITVEHPVESYDSLSVYEMEASAFMATALRFSPVELIQVIKVISDNEEHHVERVDKVLVSNLITENLPKIDETIKCLNAQLGQYCETYDDSIIYSQCEKNWHFTQYQKKSLSRLIQRWHALSDNVSFSLISQCKDAKSVIKTLETLISRCSIEY